MKTTNKHWFALTASTLGLTGLSLASGFGDEKYTYDASGNVLEKQIGEQVTRYDYTGNQLNGSTSDSSRKQYAYDSSGRLTSDSEAGKPTRSMEHQYLDKVTKVQNGDKTTELFYNAEGQLVATSSAGTSETFARDGLAMVNRGEKLYVNESHAVGGVPAIIGNDVAVSDIIGSSLSVGNGSFESTAFGEGLTDGLLTGKPFIEDLGGFRFMYRTYSATDACWTTADPSGYPDGKNNKSFVLGNPVSNFDQLGLWTSEGQPPTGQTLGTLTTVAPITAPMIIFTTTQWARKFTNDAWDYASKNYDYGNYGDALSGSFSASTSTSLTIEVGIQQGAVSVGASKTVATDVGVTRNYDKPAVPDKAWGCRGLVGKGDVTQIETEFKYNKTTGVWVAIKDTGSTPYVAHVIPEISSKEYFFQIEK